MSYEIYKVIHFLGLFLLMFSLGALALQAMQSGPAKFAQKKLLMIFHGIGLFLMLLGGFGLLARLGMARDMPNWVLAKLVIWVLLGGLAALVIRKQSLKSLLIPLIIILPTIAAYLAIYKPF